MELMTDVTGYLANGAAPWREAQDVAINAMRLEQLRALGCLRDPREDDEPDAGE